jgi:hypothetical protein
MQKQQKEITKYKRYIEENGIVLKEKNKWVKKRRKQ